MPDPSPIFRFAPSPTGALHLGNGFSALYSFAAAQATQAAGGRFLLRVEDIDQGRCRPEYEAAMLADLAWLGLVWETPVRRQSEHMADYAAALATLDDAGLIYPCFCTRKQIAREIAAAPSAPHGPDGARYPGTCRNLSKSARKDKIAAGTPYALRLDSAAAAARVAANLTWHDRGKGIQTCRPTAHGDVVLARKDTPTSYHLAVTVDDALQGVSCVTRGMDLFAASHVHRLLQALLDLPTPEYDHHRLLLDDEGSRLAKRQGSISLADMRAAGTDPVALRRDLGFEF
ncbi:MAG: tRNA glutamyl-Q(34) synthetase GluQRS [Rhodospirillaceae bacterium]|jgi:glutamyl-Q tRNA(Asp) synthetase|nr:tRNA glutamyl-Q(34) synthetase GluQRS [Rhodospirillaceae bacterium]MBT5083348.1 tRNA glutamyl-Q(34) synthetase GluQRS [Rhodospirillaceae bacterium]MBT5523380.1 tRNA glutamyl-Q(34) synthetase GluQRS [Rhodospirillaceae bacterium]MBT5879367.1 tRNA glutamyl-Q(34) synthetase GluQRS [Rhodospirillaceae bacterium]MBT6589960.1 tRNA glutamyl-Q(34) synthetase GluQRS [Rhodospirillaceae bacterium]